jgi:hypothetical protein
VFLVVALYLSSRLPQKQGLVGMHVLELKQQGLGMENRKVPTNNSCGGQAYYLYLYPGEGAPYEPNRAIPSGWGCYAPLMVACAIIELALNTWLAKLP